MQQHLIKCVDFVTINSHSTYCINVVEAFASYPGAFLQTEIVYKFKVWHIVAWICQGYKLRHETEKKENNITDSTS